MARHLHSATAVMFQEGTVTRSDTNGNEQGFSMIELVIAMTVTLIISGAVFQLVTAGQSAFRREPGLADRQQSIRMAMDLISQDLYGAGYGMPSFAQVFTSDLDGVGSMGATGTPTDEIEIFSSTDCGSLQICDVGGVSVTTFEALSTCYNLPSMVILANATEFHPYWAEAPGGGSNSSCTPGGGSGSRNGHVVVAAGQSSHNNPGGPNAVFNNPPEYMLVGQLIRYRITQDAEGVPSLERSAFGGEDWPGGGTSWEAIARGVEDLQIEYLNGVGWQDEPGIINCGGACGSPGQADYDTLVRRVRVRLSARSLVANLAGQTENANVGNAVRGELISEVAPRAAHVSLGQGNGEM
jgi:prepilin-type N-terminal cleavage/methylation domain-containing protein